VVVQSSAIRMTFLSLMASNLMIALGVHQAEWVQVLACWLIVSVVSVISRRRNSVVACPQMATRLNIIVNIPTIPAVKKAVTKIELTLMTIKIDLE